MNGDGYIITPESEPLYEFTHIQANTFHASTLIGEKQARGIQRAVIKQFGGPTKVEWATIEIIAANPGIDPVEATQLAIKGLQAVAYVTAELRKQAEAAKAAGDVANVKRTSGPNGSPG